MADSPRKRLEKIKSGIWSRGLAMAKVTVAAGAEVAGHAVSTFMASDDERAQKLKELLVSQANRLTTELGALKGSLMKVGQMLSMAGEQFLPPEATQILKSLQSSSPPLAWPEIHKQLRAELGDDKLAELIIDEEPAASASLGQVHRARVKDASGAATGPWLALKVQYPGVDRAIDSDLRTLKRLLGIAQLLPQSANTDALFEEVRQMLHQETDYVQERERTQEFARLLAGDVRFAIPAIEERYCTRRILATHWQEGVAVDGPEVAALSQERRNALAQAYLELYFKELFEWGMVQSDPHFGNYKIQLAHNPGEPDRLVCFDFGAVRKFTPEFLNPYRALVRGAFHQDRAAVEQSCRALGLILDSDGPEWRRDIVGFCILITEPFLGAMPYDWGHSDLPKRVARVFLPLAMTLKKRAPSSEFIFNDRKIGGVFIFVARLGAVVDSRALIAPYMG